MRDSWARKLFIDNASIYLPILESGLAKAPVEVHGLIRQFRKFRVPQRGTILDVSCGIGRHSIYLAKRGYDVVGYDPSATFLKKARQLAKRMLHSRDRIRFYCGEPADIVDVLRDKCEDGFDAIISMDYSFGYSTRQDDVRLFKSLLSLANQKCVLVIETGNKDFWLKHFQYYFRESFPDGLERLMAFRLDRRKSILKADLELYRRLNDKSLKHLLSVPFTPLIYSEESLSQLIKTAGWRPVRTFENIRHPRKVSDSVPIFFMVAREFAPGVR